MTLAGAELLRIFSIDYVSARFPRLPRDSFELAVKVYTSRTNIYAAAKSVGMEYALVSFTGIPAVKMPTLEEHLRSLRPVEEEEATRDDDETGPASDALAVSTSSFYSDIFAAIVGMIHKEQVPDDHWPLPDQLPI